jgi:lactate dehydrogenase-like 2-hydroxyacid dehydrogenase
MGIKFVEMEFLLEKSDIICFFLPLNNITRAMFDLTKLRYIKKEAIIVSISPLGIFNIPDFNSFLTDNPDISIGLDISSADKKQIEASINNSSIITNQRAALSSGVICKMDMEIARKIVKYFARSNI